MNAPGSRVAIAILAAAVLVAAGLVGSSLLQSARTITSTSEKVITIPTTVIDVITSNTTVTVNATQSQPSTSQTASSNEQSRTSTSACTITGTGGPVYFQVVTVEGIPVSNETIRMVHTSPCGTPTLAPMQTNATGWVEVQTNDGFPYAGSFEVSFIYLDQDYNTTINIEPLLMSLVTYYVPSGQTYSVNCLPSGCVTTTTGTMSMGG